MARVYLQRHTQVDVAPQICYGVSDVALCPEFESRDLPEVISRTKGLSISKIYSSPLSRCAVLAQRLAPEFGISEVVLDERLMELNFGDWELVTWDDIFNSQQGKGWFDDFLNCKTPNGESFSQMVCRAESFLGEVRGEEQDIIVVTHSGFMRAALVAEQRVTLQEAFDIKIEYGKLIEL